MCGRVNDMVVVGAVSHDSISVGEMLYVYDGVVTVRMVWLVTSVWCDQDFRHVELLDLLGGQSLMLSRRHWGTAWRKICDDEAAA